MLASWNQFIGRAWGFCWHGLCVGGQVSLPNGTQRSYPQPSDGDVYVVQVPGQVAPSRTSDEGAADTAAGRSWLPYALLAGSTKRYAGQVLGANAWIYVAADKSRWLVSAAFSGTNPHTATLTVKRFGEFGRTPEIYLLPVGPANVGAAGAPIFFDASSTGDRAVFGIGSREQAKALLLITLTGAGSGLAATLTVHRSYAQCRPSPTHAHSSLQFQFDTIHPDVVIASGCQGDSETWTPDTTMHTSSITADEHNDDVTIIFGAVFDAADQLHDVTCHLQARITQNAPSSSLNASGSTTRVWSLPGCAGNVLSHTGTISWSGRITQVDEAQFMEARLAIGMVQSTCRIDAAIGVWSDHNIVRVPHQPISDTSTPHDYSAYEITPGGANTGALKVDGQTIGLDVGKPMTSSQDLNYIDSDYVHPFTGQFEGYTLTNRGTPPGTPMITMSPVRLTNKLFGLKLTTTLIAQSTHRRAIAKKLSPYGTHGAVIDDLGLMTAPGVPNYTLQPVTLQFDHRLNQAACWI